MTHIPRLFTPLTLGSITFSNRIWVSPMCQYSSVDGHPTDWHFVHLGSRAVGGAGLVMVEATAVNPQGRISPADSGIWSDEHIPSFKRITNFIKSQGTVAGIQIAHAGRKASTTLPWLGDGAVREEEGGWQTLAPSAIPFKASYTKPCEMTHADIEQCIKDFVSATQRCLKAGFQVLEIHMAHGYLIHEFLSPLSNERKDEYGGNLENRMRFALQIAQAVRDHWPRELPLFVRISATDWAGGPQELVDLDNKEIAKNAWNLPESVILCEKLKALGIDLIDCSSGGLLPDAKIPIGPGYQVRFAQAIRQQTGIKMAAVGMITDPIQAEAILVQQQADAIFMAREMLRQPYWPYQAAKTLGFSIPKPNQYVRS